MATELKAIDRLLPISQMAVKMTILPNVSEVILKTAHILSYLMVNAIALRLILRMLYRPTCHRGKRTVWTFLTP